MRYLKKYNEGILSKGRELLNYNKTADLLIKKYIKKIYEDYKLNKDLFRCSIRQNDGYTTLSYLITDGNNIDIQWGNRDENAITIELTFVNNIFKWTNDETQARLEVVKFQSYKGTYPIVGRHIDTGKIEEDENGIKGDLVSYVNVPSGEVKKIIDFFKKEYKAKYPKVSKYFLKSKVMELYPEISNEEKNKSEILRNKEREEYENKRLDSEKLTKSKFDLLKMDSEDLLEYFQEVEDEMRIDVVYEKNIFLNETIYTSKKYKFNEKEIISEYSLNSTLNKNKYGLKEEEIELEKDVPYHTLIVNLIDDDVKLDDFKSSIKKVIDRFCKQSFGLHLKNSYFMDNDHNGDYDGGTIENYACKIAYEETTRMSFLNIRASYVFFLYE